MCISNITIRKMNGRTTLQLNCNTGEFLLSTSEAYDICPAKLHVSRGRFTLLCLAAYIRNTDATNAFVYQLKAVKHFPFIFFITATSSGRCCYD